MGMEMNEVKFDVLRRFECDLLTSFVNNIQFCILIASKDGIP